MQARAPKTLTAEGRVEGVDVGDYQWLRLRTGKGEELTFLVGEGFQGDPAAWVGRKVRARYLKAKVSLPESGRKAHEELVLLALEKA